MSKYLSGIIAVALAVGLSAFTSEQKSKTFIKNGKVYTSYWYTFAGSQTTNGRQVKTDYVNPTTTQPNCSGTGHECIVQIVGITGTPPTDISSFNVTFNGSGYPNGGTDFGSNVQKDPPL